MEKRLIGFRNVLLAVVVAVSTVIGGSEMIESRRNDEAIRVAIDISQVAARSKAGYETDGQWVKAKTGDRELCDRIGEGEVLALVQCQWLYGGVGLIAYRYN